MTLPGGGRIGPISWDLERGRRIRVRCATDGQWTAFVALLTGQQAPAEGVLEEVRSVRVQTDVHLRETLDLNRTVQEFLQAPDTPESVWLDGRRRSLWVLVDQLGLAPANTRRVLKLESTAVQHKYWVLRFLLSQADLVIGREVFRSDDPQVQAALRRRWGDLPGALLAGESDRPLPGRADAWLAFDADGRFSSGTEAPDEPTPPEG